MGGDGIGGGSPTGNTFLDAIIFPVTISTNALHYIGEGVDEAKGFMEGPDIPDAPTPEPEVDVADEGVRRGELSRMKRKKAMGEAFLTRGQERDVGATLGGMAKTLG